MSQDVSLRFAGVVRWGLLAPLLLSACVSSPPVELARGGASDPDVDPFGLALDRAAVRYRQEAELAVARSYRTPDEAEAVLIELRRERFDQLVEQELARSHLSPQQLRSHVLEHRACAAQQTVAEGVADGISMLAERVRARVLERPDVHPFDRQLDDPAGPIATR